MEKLNTLACISRVLEEVRKDSPEMATQTLQVFLAVAADPGISALEIRQRLGILRSSASRNLAALTAVAETGKPGLDWLYKEPCPTDARILQYYLTPKGEDVIRRICKAF